jgi:D-alanyl-D-alanine carboxypeptidase
MDSWNRGKMLTGKCVASLATVAIAACATSQAATPPPAHLQVISDQIQADCAAGRFSGVVAIEQHGRPLFLRHCGFGDAGRTAPLDAEGRFKIFSTSKVFTAAAVLSLIADGRMQLDDRLVSHVPLAPQEWSDVTVRHLLNHRSGISDFTNELLEAYRSQGARTHSTAMHHVLRSLAEEQRALASAPGSVWEYSNFGYELLALAAEVADGRSFHEVLRRRVFAPAGMHDAIVEMPGPPAPELTSAPDPKLVQGFNGSAAEWMPATSYSFVQLGAGAIHAGYRDLLAFDQALRRGQIVPMALQQANEADAVPTPGSALYGYGWMIRRAGGCTYWHHSGGTNGYTSEFARDPRQGYAVVILSNLGFAQPSELRRQLMDLLLKTSGCLAD